MEALLQRGLRFVLCPASSAGVAERVAQEQIRDCWSEVWGATYREFGRDQGPAPMVLEAQDLLGGLFVGARCVAMLSFRSVHGHRQELASDEYFAKWPRESRDLIQRDGPALLIANHFAIRADSRGERFPVSLKKLLTGLAMQTFLHSRADAMAGAVRVDRRMTPTMIGWGGRVLMERISWELDDRNTDLIGFFRAEVEAAAHLHEHAALVSALWSQARLIPVLEANSLDGRAD